MRIKFVSYYTPIYEEMAARLTKSLDKFGCDFLVQPIEDFNEEPGKRFIENVKYKPKFILECMRRFCEYDAIVWTDADSELVAPPRLLHEIECDMACRFRDAFELLSGTMLWRVCYKVCKFLPHWIAMVDEKSEGLPCPEQQVLQEMVPHSGLDVYRLPEEYVYIADTKEPGDMRDKNNKARHVEPVCVHHQASRETRNL